MKYLLLGVLFWFCMPTWAEQPSNDSVTLQSLLTTATKIQFEPYRGNLRSVDFVNQTQKANAFDRSLSLLEAIKAAGFRGHLAHGNLSDKHKQALISQMAQTYRLKGQGALQGSADLNEILSEHFWVEVIYKNQLTPMDASFIGAKLGDSYGTKKGVVTNLNPYQYKIALSHKLQNKSGSIRKLGSYSTTAVLLDLDTITLTTQTEPLLGSTTRPGGIGGALSGLAGGIAGRDPTDTDKNASVIGNIYRTTLTHKSKSRDFGVYQNSFNITNAAITREWLEITLQYPGETPKVIERNLYTSQSNQPLPSNHRHVVINVLPGEILPNVTQGIAQKVKAQLPKQAQLDSASAKINTTKKLNQQLGPLSGWLFNLRIAANADKATRQLASRNQIMAVYDQPRIYITTMTGDFDENKKNKRYEITFDYRVDDIGVYSNATHLQAANYFFQMARGLQQATVEGLLVAQLKDSPQVSTPAIMTLANQQNIAIKVLTMAQLDSIESIDQLNSVAKYHITSALNRGYHVVVPEQPVMIDKQLQWAWWQVDPITGKTIGVLGNGLHGAFVEYNITQRETTINGQSGFVLGMLVGANSTHMLMISHMIAGNVIDEQLIASIEAQLQQMACEACPADVGIETGLSVSATASLGCFEVFQLTVLDRSTSYEVSFPFCEGFSSGFNCAVKMVLHGIDFSPSVDPEVSVGAINTELFCP